MKQAPTVADASGLNDEIETPELSPAPANPVVAEDASPSVAVVPSTQEEVESPTSHTPASPVSTHAAPVSTPAEGVEEGCNLPLAENAVASDVLADLPAPAAALPTPPAPAAMPESGTASEAATTNMLPPAESMSSPSSVRPLAPSAISFTDVAIKCVLKERES